LRSNPSFVLRILGLLVFVTNVPALPRAHADAITVRATPLPLDAQQPERSRVGRLDYRGGLELSSTDNRFGGLSGLRVSADGRTFVAISDRGFRVGGSLVYDRAGWLAGLADVSIDALVGPKGRSIAWLPEGDAEALETAESGEIIAFETRPRLLLYPVGGGVPSTLPSPEGLERAPSNKGIEALTRLHDGRLLALTEGLQVAGGRRGWIGSESGGWSALTWRTDEGFEPTDATSLPDGDVLVLERRFPPIGVRVRLLKGADIAPGAVLDGAEVARFEGSLNFDNMEGIDARVGAGNEVLVYLVSDDNYNILQRTVLLMFRLVE
jgi:hypothetical protein